MYKLNGTEITAEYADELIRDLALYPYDKNDLELSAEERNAKYLKAIKKKREMKLSDNLVLAYFAKD